MNFGDLYTTAEMKDADSKLKPEEQTEQTKIVVSTDAYAVGGALQSLKDSVNSAIVRLKQ